jgi:hypothetical protein
MLSVGALMREMAFQIGHLDQAQLRIRHSDEKTIGGDTGDEN